MAKSGLRTIAALVLLVVATSSQAASTSGPPPQRAPLSSYPWDDPSALGTSNTTKLYASPVACKPDDADPVWGPPGDTLLGFSCRSPRTIPGS